MLPEAPQANSWCFPVPCRPALYVLGGSLRRARHGPASRLCCHMSYLIDSGAISKMSMGFDFGIQLWPYYSSYVGSMAHGLPRKFHCNLQQDLERKGYKIRFVEVSPPDTDSDHTPELKLY